MIKKFYLLTTLLSITASPLCYTMKNNLLINNNDVPNNSPIQQATIFAKITAVEKPEKALYLTPHHALINGINECSIVDIRTNKEIKKISDKSNTFVWSHISVHPNLKKFAFCSESNDGNQNVIIYDAITYSAECSIKCDGSIYIRSCYFSPLDTTIATRIHNNSKVVLYNYKTNAKPIIDIQDEAILRSPIISFHPTKPLVYLAWKNLYSFNLETSETKKLAIGPEQNYHKFCECSPDGLFIARGTEKNIIITNLDTLSNKTIIDETYGRYANNIAIHPNNKILLTLSSSAYILRYWEINTSKLIITTTVVPFYTSSHYNLSLSICPNEANLLLVINGECMEIEIPFEARYKDLTKNAGVFACFALQHYRHDGANQLPGDIIQLLITALLKASKY